MNTLGYLVAKRPAITLTLVLVLVLICAPFALALAFPSFVGVNNHLLGSGFTKPESASVQASRMLEQNFQLSSHNSLTIVYHSNSDYRVTDDPVRETIGKSLERIGSYTNHVSSTVSFLNNPDPHLVSSDQKTTYAVLNLTGSDQEVQNLVPKVQEASRIEGLDVKVGGGPAFYYDLQNQGKHDIFKLEFFGIIAIALAMLILGRLFGFGLSGLISLAVAVAAIPISWAIVYIIAGFAPMSVFAMSIASMLTLAYTTNYSLLLIKTFRRHLVPTAGIVHRPNSALRLTIKEAGETVVGAGLVAISAGIWLAFANGILPHLGLGSLSSGTNLVFQSIGLAALISAGVSLLVAFSVTIALLKLKSSWFASKRTVKPGSSRSFWQKWDSWVYNHPIRSLLIPMVIILVVGFGAWEFKWTWAAFDSVSAEKESHVAQTLLAENFGEGESSPIFILYDSGSPTGVWTQPAQTEIASITIWLKETDKVSRVESLASLGLQTDEQYLLWQKGQMPLLVDEKAQVSLIKVTPRQDFSREETLNLARDLRTRLKQAPLSGSTQVAGVPIENVDFLDYDREQLVVMLSGMALILGSVITLLTRRPILAVKAVLMAGLAYLMALGSLAWIFTGFGLSEGLNGTVPAILLILLAASGSDFEYFLLNPARQLHDAGKSNREAILSSLDQSRPVIVVGAVMLFIAFGVWHLSQVEPVQQIGDGQALGILADVVLIRFILVPSFMSLMGEANWWTPRLPKWRRKPSPAYPASEQRN